jgi:2-amino-4-hydroxy-6-hydroxymethyldihydropteridine diphosphokinase
MATLAGALHELESLPRTTLLCRSRFFEFPPIGGPAGQDFFLNAAALVATNLSAEELLAELQQIEARCGRTSSERWAARTLDLDLLLYDQLVVEVNQLVLPHPRMSFRRFVLEPAAEIVPQMIVPTIGWSIEQLFDQVCSANDRLAILSSASDLRWELSRQITSQLDAHVVERDIDQALWPEEHTTWISLAGDPRPVGNQPKLTVVLSDNPGEWRQPGRGPTLRLGTLNQVGIEQEISAAIETAWPELGRPGIAGIE